MESGVDIDAIEERFLVHGRMEILALLNELIYCGEPVEVRFGSEGSCITRLLEARDQTVVFEASENSQTNIRLAAAADCTFLASPQGIRVMFSAGRAIPLTWGGIAAFSVALPTRLARLQRQESFRTIIPAQQAPAVTLHADDGSLLGRWPLRDLSVGGIGVAIATEAELQRATKSSRVQLLIPGCDAVACAVSVRHATGLAESDDEFGFRLGLGFIDLPETMRVEILRYIVDVERARRVAPPSTQAED